MNSVENECLCCILGLNYVDAVIFDFGYRRDMITKLEMLDISSSLISWTESQKVKEKKITVTNNNFF